MHVMRRRISRCMLIFLASMLTISTKATKVYGATEDTRHMSKVAMTDSFSITESSTLSTTATTTTTTQTTTTTTSTTTTTEITTTETTTYRVAPMEESNATISINETVDGWTDVQLLAHIINAEAGNCTMEEILWTGQVVLNRVASPYFPNTIREVVFQKGQYSPTWTGSIYKEPTAASLQAAQLLMEGNRYIPSNVLFQTGGNLKYELYAVTPNGLYFYMYGR